MRTKFYEIDKIYFFSDGAGGQYKNKMNFYNLCQIEKVYRIKAQWHFFASCHGKGPCDAVGGTLKRMAKTASLQRSHTEQITTAKELYEFIKTKPDIKIEVDFCSEKDHNDEKKENNSPISCYYSAQ